MAQKRTIDIDINTNADQAAKEFDNLGKATKVANDSLEGLNKTFEEANGDIQPLTARMGEAEDRLYELALAGDTTSKEYQGLLNKVGEYRKVQIQTDLAVDGAAQTMTQKLGSALNGATSGFAATQGAMALFGSENQALEESLLKVQSALAIQQGVKGLTDSYKELGIGTKIAAAAQATFTFVTGGATAGLKLFRLALISTGIGAAVVAIGFLIANFDKLLIPLNAAKNALKSFGDAIGLTNFKQEEAKQAVIDRSLAEKKASIQRLKDIDKEIAAIDSQAEAEKRLTSVKLRQIALDQAKAKSTQEVVDLEKQATDAKIALNNKEYNDFVEKQKLTLEKHEEEARLLQGVIDRNIARGRSDHTNEVRLLKERKDIIAKLNNDILTNNFDFYTENQIAREEIEAEGQRKVDDIRKAAQDQWKAYAAERLSIARKIEDLENKSMEEGLEKELEMNRDSFRRQREDITAKGEDKLRLIELYNQLELQEEKKIRDEFDVFKTESFDFEIAQLEIQSAKEIEIVKEKNVQLKGLSKELSDEEKANNLSVQQSKIQFANDAFGALSDLTNAFAGESEKSQKKAFQINKAIGIAQAVINTAGAVSAAINPAVGGLGIPAGLPGAVLAAATGAAQIATIAKTEFGGGGGGETPSVDASGGAAQAPSFNVVGDSSVNQLAQLQQQPVQAFVVSGEVTTSQALDRNRVENATL